MTLVITRKQLYWLCQLSGWGLYTTTIFFVNMARRGDDTALSLPDLIPFIQLPIQGILLTHAYRSVIKEYRWLYLSLPSQILHILIASILLSTLMNGLILAYEFLTPGRHVYSYTSLQLFSNFFNQAAVMLIWSLIYFALHYFSNYKYEEIERHKQQADLRAMELHTLRSQINPHFIFNALNSIRALILENPEHAQECVTRLSKLLRNSLYSNQHDRIPLRDELEAVADYLALEQIRYEERLQVRIDAQPDTLAWPVPALSLLTLVENAIKHGIAEQVRGGLLEVEAHAEGESLLLTVRNTGILNPDDAAGGYGLQNIKDRLRILYQEKGDIQLIQEETNTVCATLRIPRNARTPEIVVT